MSVFTKFMHIFKRESRKSLESMAANTINYNSNLVCFDAVTYRAWSVFENEGISKAVS